MSGIKLCKKFSNEFLYNLRDELQKYDPNILLLEDKSVCNCSKQESYSELDPDCPILSFTLSSHFETCLTDKKMHKIKNSMLQSGVEDYLNKSQVSKKTISTKMKSFQKKTGKKFKSGANATGDVIVEGLSVFGKIVLVVGEVAIEVLADMA